MQGNNLSAMETISCLKARLNRPLAIGNQSIDKRLILAPMTDLGTIAFREIVREMGGYGLLYTEMCNARRIPHENRSVSPYFKWADGELNQLVCQIVGDGPEEMAAAAEKIEASGFFGVDINLGCSANKICRVGCGAALLKTPAKARKIVAAVRDAISIPLTVKFRTGWTDTPMIPADLAAQFEDAGADALIFHPRVAPDRRLRPARWSYIKKVKQAVTIPVFGNGDVFSEQDCLNMLTSTGCDGVAIGRIAIAKPWIFACWTDGIFPDVDDYARIAKKMILYLDRHFDHPISIKRFKKFSFYFSANFKFGHTLHSKILGSQNLKDAEQVVNDFFREPPEISSRPNMNYFR